MAKCTGRKDIRVPTHQKIDLTGPTITVRVGKDESAKFIIHRDIVCKSSNFFRTALSEKWKEGREQEISLPEEDTKVFELYMHWLYRGTLPVRNDVPTDKYNCNLEYVWITQAYILGDRLQDHNFMDATIDAILEKSKSKATDGKCHLPGFQRISFIYEKTPDSSKMRELLVDLYAFHATAGALKKSEFYGLPKQFLAELSITMLNARALPAKGGPQNEFNPCKYHQHGINPLLCCKNQDSHREDI